MSENTPANNTVGVDYDDDGITEFPMIMQNPESGTIFLIVGKNTKGSHKGFILADGTRNPSAMGRFSEKWKKNLKPYKGSITLSNKPS